MSPAPEGLPCLLPAACKRQNGDSFGRHSHRTLIPRPIARSVCALELFLDGGLPLFSQCGSPPWQCSGRRFHL